MDVAITGSSGLIGTALATALRARGDVVIPVVRGDGRGVRWDPAAGTIDAEALEGVAAIVHLAGEGIGEKKWTPEQKQAIRDSRVDGTTLLANALAGLDRRPQVLVSGSAIGWYGNRGDEELTETSPPPPSGFLADVCTEWEAATAPAEAAGIRTVHLRTGIVLSRDGGALARMITPFKLGVGGRIGSGNQYMSWISIDDEVGAILHAIDTPSVHGAVNATAPNPATNREFTKALGHALHRPTLLPTPLTPLKLVYGRELVRNLLVDGQKVLPAQLLASGYEFQHPELAGALDAMDL
ncbi:MAG: TIGR01777 family oxidoreductase [Acidimicrobiia bacterium]|nr:TIGR01777 family oxidoreductase [Acidimicrobiia bacterium]